MGKLNLGADHVVYTGSTHWNIMLEDLQHLKDDLSDEHSPVTSSIESAIDDGVFINNSPGTRISLINSGPDLSSEQIIAMMPPRKIVDRLISQFFNNFDMAPYILCRKAFLEEYSTFWIHPTRTPIMWVGLLFSILSMSALIQRRDIEALGLSTEESQGTLDTYRWLTIQCLVAGDYLHTTKYTLETLALHFSVDQNINMDTSIGNWILVGVVFRVALRMGLHRDPAHWPNIRPLQAELRRRLWLILYQMDFFISTQVGLPRSIKDSQCDTRLPKHLLENDLTPDSEEMPSQRPLTEATPLLHAIQRHSIIKIAAEIYDATEAGPPSPLAITTLGAKLKRVVDSLPTSARYQPLDAAVTDNPGTIVNQILLDILIHKATYLLYRRSFVKDLRGEEAENSNELCINAALAILEYQRKINEEIQPGGLFYGIRWKIATPLNHEFLQATMMLCFAVHRINERCSGKATAAALQRRDGIVEALIQAKYVWEVIADTSSEAREASAAIATVLQQASAKASGQSFTMPDAFFGSIPGAAAENFLADFDYSQTMALDYSMFTVDELFLDNILEDTSTGQYQGTEL
ncbi:fungal-specific transcription factor domain-containing protein [Xylariales sp. PMI_506]|nr:fungal-specific transcription factor domain-containing protein [Xylariales sp. PMI_506]